jgi:hypothetical protein
MKIKRNVGFVWMLFLIIFFSGCTSVDISKEIITKIDSILLDNADKEISSIVPGQTYRLKVLVYDAKNKVISNPDYQKFNFNSPNSTLSYEKWALVGPMIIAAKDTVELIGKKRFELSISVKDNPFPPLLKTWPVNWDQFNTLSFQDKDGMDGSKGRDGLNATGGFESMINGGDGSNGQDGSRGMDGKNVQLIVAYYNISDLAIDGLSDQKVLLFYEITEKSLTISRLQPFYLNSSGGKGGDGGDGGNAGRGAEYRKEERSPFASPAPPSFTYVRGKDGLSGSGGNGASGGNAGDITIWYYDASVLDLINPVMNGGQSGEPGKPGQGGSMGGSGHGGGKGMDGKFHPVEKSFEEILEVLNSIERKDFEISRIIR